MLTVGGLHLPNGPILVGAGANRDPRTEDRWSPVMPMVGGSYTLAPREGNPGITFYPDPNGRFAVNWLSMPCIGAPRAAAAFAQYHERGRTRKLIISVAGFSVQEIVAIVRHFVGALGKGLVIELNFGCPNTETGKIQSHDFAFMQSVLGTLEQEGLTSDTLYWVKLSPYMHEHQARAAAAVIIPFGRFVRAVVASNTVPYPNNTLGVELPAGISPPPGQGGISGPIVHNLALQQVQWFASYLPPSIDVIGSGGVTTGAAIKRFLDRGARAVQTTTLPFQIPDATRVLEILLEDGELATLSTV